MTRRTNLPLAGHQAEFLLYQTEDGRIQVETRLQDETVWLTQQGMAELFQTTKQNISLHIHRIFQEQELHQDATVKQYLTVRQEDSWQIHFIEAEEKLKAIVDGRKRRP